MTWVRVEKGIRKRQDKDGRWIYYARVRRGDEYKEIRVGSNLSMARQVRNKLEIDMVEADVFPERRKISVINLEDYADEYIERYLKTYAPKSWQKAENRVKNIVRLMGKNKPVNAIGIRDVEHLLGLLKKKGDRPSTLNRYRSRLRSMMKQAVRWGYATHNPVDEVDSQTEQKFGDRYLDSHELRELVDACDDRLWPMVLFAAATGLRQGEIIALRWADIDSKGRTVTVRSETSKTSEGRRVPLNQDACNALAACSKEDPVFGWNRFPSEFWAEAIKELKWRGDHVDSRLKNWRFHDLRHYADHRIMPTGLMRPIEVAHELLPYSA